MVKAKYQDLIISQFKFIMLVNQYELPIFWKKLEPRSYEVKKA